MNAMFKTLLILFMFSICAETFSQTSTQNPSLFSYNFIFLPRTSNGLWSFHYVPVKYEVQESDAQKRTEDYRYIHNGDDLKGAEGILNGDELGANWLKNFDFGKFASVVLEMNGDSNGHLKGGFVWSGKLVFFKVINKRKIGRGEPRSG